MAQDSIELVDKAPKVCIETVLIVRPIKVIACVIGFVGALFILCSTAASAWLISDDAREGIWERCVFLQTNATVEEMDCGFKLLSEWVKAPQTLSLISLFVCVFGVIIITVALRSSSVSLKPKLYWVAIIAFLVAVGFELISLVAYPIKFLQEVGDDQRENGDWKFGWSYIVGWAGALCEFAAGIFLLCDRTADEVIYREVVEEGIEEA